MALAQLRSDGYTVTRAPAAQFSLLRQIYIVSKGDASRSVALRTSTTGWIGFRRDGDRFPTLDGVDSVLHVNLRPTRDSFWFKLVPVGFVVEYLRLVMAVHVAKKKPSEPIIWIAGDIFHADATDDDFIPPLLHFLPDGKTDDEDADPEQIRPEFATALGMPDWLEAVILERSMMAVTSPEDLLRTILVDHFAPLRPVAVADTVVPLSVGIPLWAMTALSARAEGLGMDAPELLKVMAVRAAVDEATPGVTGLARGLI
jgi:hypothetical protein